MSQLSDYLADELKSSEETLDLTMDGVTAEHASAAPGGLANTIASIYTHAITSEDVLTGQICGQPTLWSSEWMAKLSGTEGVAEGFLNEHVKAFKFDLEAFKPYAQAVYERAREVVRGLSDDDLERKIDMGEAGQPTVKEVVRDYIIWHNAFHSGEISSQKGVLGLQGVPF